MRDVKQATLLLAEDWVALYFDGLKVVEGHSLNHFDLFEALEIPLTTKDVSLDSLEFFANRLEDLGQDQ